jgi:hypothetical protein
MIAVTPCGSKKKDQADVACRLYTGPYFKKCIGYAFQKVGAQNTYILSAKYGLVRPNEVLEPYDVHMQDPSSVGVASVRSDARRFSLLNESAIILGGKDYRQVALKVWPNAETPLQGKGGMGEQMKWLNHQINREANQ